MSVLEAARKGRLELYLVLRQLTAEQLDAGCGAREQSSLTILLLKLSQEIEEMTAERERPWIVPPTPGVGAMPTRPLDS
jgi:hypothetical protein